MSTLIPLADQRLTPVNFNAGGVTRPPRGMVLHSAEGSYEGTIQWAKNPSAKVSYYAVVSRAGLVAQVVDLDNKAWTQGSGNKEWIGIEFEGHTPAPLSPPQVAAAAALLAWLHTHYGVPIQITDDPVNGRGLAYHGLGHAVGWGHPECPGPAIVAQRPEIVKQALALVGGGNEDLDMDAKELEAIIDKVVKKRVDAAIEDNHSVIRNLITRFGPSWTSKTAE